jgi:hypothetical protein
MYMRNTRPPFVGTFTIRWICDIYFKFYYNDLDPQFLRALGTGKRAMPSGQQGHNQQNFLVELH